MSTEARFRVVAALLFSFLIPLSKSALAEPVDLGEWVTAGTAVVQDGEIILTTDTANQSGSVTLSRPICAGKFRLSFDLNMGINTATRGGLGIATFARTAAGVLALRAHADSSFQSSEDQRYELNDNHVSLESLWAPTDAFGNPPVSGNYVFGPIASARMPFLMKAAGWFHGELYRDGQQIQLTFSDGTSGLLLNGTIYPEPGESFYLGFSGDTSATARNLQRVRDVHLDLIDRSECADYTPPLTRGEAHDEIVARCGDVSNCPARESYLTCVQTGLSEMLQAARVTGADSDFLLLEAQYGLTFCDGYKQCETEIDPAAVRAEGYASGFTDGAASIDQQGIRAAGYDAGFSDGDAKGYATGYQDGDAAGYSRGYSAGNSDGHAAGYASGLSDGDASGYARGYSDGRAVGFTDGKSAGYASGYSDGYKKGTEEGSGQCTLDKALDAFKQRILAACPCSDKRGKGGDYMSCTRTLLNSMRRSGEIDSRLESSMYEAVRLNQCRGELRFKIPWWSW